MIATGGLPDLEWLAGHEHCDNVWDILSGSTKVKETVLLYDELGDHAGASCAEVLADKGAKVELAFRGHQAAQRSGYVNYPVYLKHFYEKGIALTPDRRLEKGGTSRPQAGWTSAHLRADEEVFRSRRFCPRYGEVRIWVYPR